MPNVCTYVCLNMPLKVFDAQIFKQKLAEFKDSKQTGIEIYTDGSKDKNKVTATAVIYT